MSKLEAYKATGYGAVFNLITSLSQSREERKHLLHQKKPQLLSFALPSIKSTPQLKITDAAVTSALTS